MTVLVKISSVEISSEIKVVERTTNAQDCDHSTVSSAEKHDPLPATMGSKSY